MIQEQHIRFSDDIIHIMTDAVICCIAYNEDKYIEEWTQYHINLGFSKIYIYDNSDCNTLQHLNNENIVVIHWPGRIQMMNTRNNFIEKYSFNHKWCAFIDCDEFIVLKQDKSLTDFLYTYLQCGALGLNWVFFGSNGHDKYIAEPVLKRFTKRQIGANYHIKCIVCCSDILSYDHSHFPTLKPGYNIKDVNGNIINGPFNYDGNDDLCQLNHYFTKSKEEFEERIKRGFPCANIFRAFDDFYSHDFNDIEDLTALNFYMNYNTS